MERTNTIIEDCKELSLNKLDNLKDKLNNIELFKKYDVAVFCSGSYGRLEANYHSDIDLFFVSENENISNLDKISIFSNLIEICSKEGFPPFSNDGEYLKIHSPKKITEYIGHPDDDYKNYFTTRILLLLESRCLYNQDVYNKVIEIVLDAYYTDFHEYNKDFKPIFLLNDICRYNKTLWLMYEHKRMRYDYEGKNPENKKSNGNLNNFKLQFSRRLMCFSFAISLVVGYGNNIDLNTETRKIISKTPLERLDYIKEKLPNVDGLVNEVIQLYSEFMFTVNKPKNELIGWFNNKDQRIQSFNSSKIFSEKLYKLLLEATKNAKSQGKMDLLPYFIM